MQLFILFKIRPSNPVITSFASGSTNAQHRFLVYQKCDLISNNISLEMNRYCHNLNLLSLCSLIVPVLSFLLWLPPSSMVLSFQKGHLNLDFSHFCSCYHFYLHITMCLLNLMLSTSQIHLQLGRSFWLRKHSLQACTRVRTYTNTHAHAHH